MAQRGVQLARENISCPICLDLLKDPASLTCGHSYCMNCIKTHLDIQDERKIYSCPQCRGLFVHRPVLEKNIMLADLVEQLIKTGLQATPAQHRYAGPEDVACDVCTGRNLKALKSCLVCLASYCEQHLQPHYDSAALKKHKLVEPSKKLQENICSRHDEVMKIFCRTDMQSICYLCSVDEHRGHDMVSAEAERTDKQKEINVSRQNIHRGIQDRERDVKKLQEEVEAINGSADRAVQHSEKTFADMINSIQKKSSEVKKQLRSKQETEVSRVKERQGKLEQEINDLKRKDAQLKRLALTEDNNQFLQSYSPFPRLSQSTQSCSSNTRPVRYFEDVTAAVSKARDILQDVLRETWTNISEIERPGFDASLQQPEPKTRADFLQYSQEITLDPNTVHTRLLLADGNRKAKATKKEQSYPDHTDRFTDYWQVLSAQSVTGRCYWEVEWSKGAVGVAVAYRNISRAGAESRFGFTDESWALYCDKNNSAFWHNSVDTPISDPLGTKVGVYLNPSAGTLAFYSVSKTMTLLHRVQTTFTQQLHAGLRLFNSEDSAEFRRVVQKKGSILRIRRGSRSQQQPSRWYRDTAECDSFE